MRCPNHLHSCAGTSHDTSRHLRDHHEMFHQPHNLPQRPPQPPHSPSPMMSCPPPPPQPPGVPPRHKGAFSAEGGWWRGHAWGPQRWSGRRGGCGTLSKWGVATSSAITAKNEAHTPHCHLPGGLSLDTAPQCPPPSLSPSPVGRVGTLGGKKEKKRKPAENQSHSRALRASPRASSQHPPVKSGG